MVKFTYTHQFKHGETDLALESAEHICKLLKEFSDVQVTITRKNGTRVSIIKNEFLGKGELAYVDNPDYNTFDEYEDEDDKIRLFDLDNHQKLVNLILDLTN